MKKIWSLLLAVMGMGLALAAGDDAELLARRMRETLLKQEIPSDAEAGELLKQCAPDGSFATVDYADVNRSSWKTMRHLRHTLTLAKAAADPQSRFYRSPEVIAAVKRAAACWTNRGLRSSNWWYNQIDAPRMAAKILLVADPLFAGDVAAREPLLQIIRQTPYVPDPARRSRMTGQNLVDCARIVLQLGASERDEAMIAAAVREIASTLVVTEKEGVKADGCFHQHGPQIQFGNYGLGFLTNQVELAELLSGTGFAYSPELQAVRFADGTAAAVLHQPGEFEGVSVSAPGVVLLQNDQAYYADPTHKLKSVTLTRAGKSVTLDLPRGANAGRTASCRLPQ